MGCQQSIPNQFENRLKPNHIRLRKALYGLKKAPKVWYDALHQFLTGMGFNRSESDDAVFISHDGMIFLAMYVDDLLIFDQTCERQTSTNDASTIAYFPRASLKRTSENRKRTYSLTRAIVSMTQFLRCTNPPKPSIVEDFAINFQNIFRTSYDLV